MDASMMQIPKDMNTRAEAMWRIISREVNFRNKRVIDLGCGTGDFLWRAYVAGARRVIGVELEYSKIKHLKDWEKPLDISFVLEDLNDVIGENWYDYDIAMCFSVLPYLDDIPATLQWMAHNFALCLIEAQYEPEPYNIGVASDSGMASLLTSNGFNHVKPLGYTYVEIRDAKRTIWLCSKEEITG